MIEWATRTFNDQRIGFSPILLLLAAGLGLMFTLKKTTAPRARWSTRRRRTSAQRVQTLTADQSPLAVEALPVTVPMTSEKWPGASPTIGVGRHLSTHE